MRMVIGYIDIFITKQYVMIKIEKYKSRFLTLIESTMGNVKPLLSEDTGKIGRNNPDWITLVSKLKSLTYSPRILTFTDYDDIPSQSLNWGTAKSARGKYGFAISSMLNPASDGSTTGVPPRP